MWRLVLMLAVVLTGMAIVPPHARATARGAVVFDIEDGVSKEDEFLIRESIRFAQDFAISSMGTVVHQSITVHVSPAADTGHSAFTQGAVITIATGHPVWLDSSPMHRVKIVTHEYFHVLQFELSSGHLAGPRWLIEGSAELFGFQAVESAGLVAEGAVLDRWINATLHGPMATVPLEQMESPEPEIACCFYETTPLAVNLLIQANGVRSIAKFYKGLGTITSADGWRTEFARAFGQNIDTFNAAFASYRTQISPQGYDQTALRYPARSGDGIGDAWIISAPSPITSGDQVLLTAGTVPGIPCTIVVTSAAGKPLLDRPAHAGPDGVVFWFWSVRTRSTHGQITAVVDCGGTQASADLTLS